MPYISQWRLSVKDKCSELQLKEIEEYIEENYDMSWVFGEGLFEWGEEDRTFFDKNENMYVISKRFTDVVFVLKYEPFHDEDEGQYVEYWLNGEVQEEQAKIVIPKFDINKLKHILS